MDNNSYNNLKGQGFSEQEIPILILLNEIVILHENLKKTSFEAIYKNIILQRGYRYSIDLIIKQAQAMPPAIKSNNEKTKWQELDEVVSRLRKIIQKNTDFIYLYKALSTLLPGLKHLLIKIFNETHGGKMRHFYEDLIRKIKTREIDKIGQGDFESSISPN